MSENQMSRVSVTEIEKFAGITTTVFTTYVHREWITPFSEEFVDQEDLSRIKLILELKNSFGVNDESIGLILHLLDQLYSLRKTLIKPERL